jgi:dihydrolipoamide dehydrogenase
MTAKVIKTEVLVLGSGPGGYTAAFRAADLGMKVTMVEYYPIIGGVCLNVGCIPSKSLLHAARVISEVEEAKDFGLSFTDLKFDLDKIRAWKDKVVNRLTSGLKSLAKQRKVEIIQGYGKFISSTRLEVAAANGEVINIEFEYAIIAAGSLPVKIPFLPEDKRIINSTGALALTDIPDSLLIIGGGIIGMEMGTVYNALGSKVSVVELTAGLLPGVDRDLVIPLQKRMSKKFASIMLETKITKVEATDKGLLVTFEGKQAPKEPQLFAKILSCVGRAPNGKLIGADKAGINVDERGFIIVDSQLKTNIANIFAIGDINNNGPMLAHRALPEGKIAAEVIAGKKHYFEPKCIPSVAYTDPEIAWVGVTEEQAKAQNINYGKGVFPWLASGKSLASGRDDGLTKIIFNKDTNKVIGAGIAGNNAGDLIAEVTLAIEMGCEAEDLSLTIHPHPTLSESICQAAEAFEGTITDLYMPKRDK